MTTKSVGIISQSVIPHPVGEVVQFISVDGKRLAGRIRAQIKKIGKLLGYVSFNLLPEIRDAIDFAGKKLYRN
jgi:hypothetical protein